MAIIVILTVALQWRNGGARPLAEVRCCQLFFFYLDLFLRFAFELALVRHEAEPDAHVAYRLVLLSAAWVTEDPISTELGRYGLAKREIMGPNLPPHLLAVLVPR